MRSPEEQEQYLLHERFSAKPANPHMPARVALWLLIAIIPVPFGPWWLTVICLSVLAILGCMLMADKR